MLQHKPIIIWRLTYTQWYGGDQLADPRVGRLWA